jgi:hypothetical protein
VSYREVERGLRVRLHNAFVQADSAVHEALAAYLAGERGTAAGKILDAFISENVKRQAAAHKAEVRPAGRFHHLGEIMTELNRVYFHERARARITWGTASARRYRRTIQLGCYVAEEQLIRIHPSLDQVFVPRHYVAWIIFHEMLHEVFGVEQKNNRRCVHPPEFVAIEQSYPDYARCKDWESRNLYKLLRYRG